MKVGAMRAYLKKSWGSMRHLHSEMLSEMCLARVLNKSIRYFYVCNKVYKRSLSSREYSNSECKYSTKDSTDPLEFEILLEQCTPKMREYIRLLLEGYTDEQCLGKMGGKTASNLIAKGKVTQFIANRHQKYVEKQNTMKRGKKVKSNYIVHTEFKDVPCKLIKDVWATLDLYPESEVTSPKNKSVKIWRKKNGVMV